MRPYERIFRIMTYFFSAATIFVSLLALFRVVPIWIPLVGLAFIQFCQAVFSWRKQREIGIFNLGAGMIVLLVITVVAFV